MQCTRLILVANDTMRSSYLVCRERHVTSHCFFVLYSRHMLSSLVANVKRKVKRNINGGTLLNPATPD
jgi:hypothetical protein